MDVEINYYDGLLYRLLGYLPKILEIKHFNFEDAEFVCLIYIKDNIKHICLCDFVLKSEVLDIPDEIDGIPVELVNISPTLDSDLIKKIIFGNNTIRLICITKKVRSLNEIVIKNGYKGKKEELFKNIDSILRFAPNKINFTIGENLDFCEKNECIISKDEKELFLICTRKNVVIPKNVECIHYSYSLLNLYAKSSIERPICVKRIEVGDVWLGHDDLTKRNKKISSYPSPDTIEVLNELTCSLFYENEVLNLSKSIKEIDFRVFYYLGRISDISINSNFILSDNRLLLPRDGKTLIYCLRKEINKPFIIPYTVEKIERSAFHLLRDFDDNESLSFFIKRDDKMKNEILNLLHNDPQHVKIKSFANIVKTTNEEKTNESTTDAEFLFNNERCYLSKGITKDTLLIDSLSFPNSSKKIFVLTKECANIKNIVLTEGITDIEIDESCYNSYFKLEILEIPNTCEFSTKLVNLNRIKSLMMVIINPIKRIDLNVGKLSFILACKSDVKFNKYSISSKKVNEITFINNFDKSRLIITNKAYYYVYDMSEKEIGLLKIKNVDNYAPPMGIGEYKLTTMYDYYDSKIEKRNFIDEEPKNDEYIMKDFTLNNDVKSSLELEDIKRMKNKAEKEFNLKKVCHLEDLSVKIDFISKNSTVCNAVFNFYDDSIPLFLAYGDSLNEWSIFLQLSQVLSDKNYLFEFSKDEFNLDKNDFAKLHNIEKSLVLLHLLNDSGYDYIVSNYEESQKFIRNVAGSSNILDEFHEKEGNWGSENVVNILPKDIEKANNNPAINLYFDLDNMKLVLNELFDYPEGDVTEENYLVPNLFFYNGNDPSIEEVESAEKKRC